MVKRIFKEFLRVVIMIKGKRAKINVAVRNHNLI